MVVGFGVNHDAIDKYEGLITGKITYGLFATVYDKLNGNDILNPETGNASAGVVKAEVTNEGFITLSLKVVGLDTDTSKDAKLTLGVFAITTQGEQKSISYLQANAPKENEKYAYITYNDLVKTEE